jgi:hypothetical protein
MHGLFVPEQRERQRNSQELILSAFLGQAAPLLQQKRSIYAAKSGWLCGSSATKNKVI